MPYLEGKELAKVLDIVESEFEEFVSAMGGMYASIDDDSDSDSSYDPEEVARRLRNLIHGSVALLIVPCFRKNLRQRQMVWNDIWKRLGEYQEESPRWSKLNPHTHAALRDSVHDCIEDEAVQAVIPRLSEKTRSRDEVLNDPSAVRGGVRWSRVTDTSKDGCTFCHLISEVNKKHSGESELTDQHHRSAQVLSDFWTQSGMFPYPLGQKGDAMSLEERQKVRREWNKLMLNGMAGSRDD
ncbi:hypothetical protein F5Y16DRAFT_418195 [Xylariaceae sp. FL0255]|nr:hypothetical protein F5Y16DRAFT_418195 [Xylariaceae sp. FL0255]